MSSGGPAVGLRHEMLSEAVDIIRQLLDGEESVNYRGRHFDVEQAKLWDLPERRVRSGSPSQDQAPAGWPEPRPI